MKRLHHDIAQAHHTADAYAIRPTERGYALWHYRDWSKPDAGWRIIIANLKDRQAATSAALERLNLLTEDDPQPEQHMQLVNFVWHFDYGEWP